MNTSQAAANDQVHAARFPDMKARSGLPRLIATDRIGSQQSVKKLIATRVSSTQMNGLFKACRNCTMA